MDVEKYLQGFFAGTKDPSLDAMRFFMDKLNHPEKELKFIHIAGTNGKGAVTEMISNILLNSGYKVGKFMSPHLIRYNERIQINNKEITNKEMEEIIIKLDPLVKEYNSKGKGNVTLFELETTMAILYFANKNCDIVVLEVGLGGLYDCTNIVYPIVSIITSIGYDHMKFLGNTLEEIAFQKAGIIKQYSKTIFMSQSESVDNVIIERCKEENNKLFLVNKEEIKNYSYTEKYQKFDYKEFKNIEINLKGISQIYNACIALETVNVLKEKYNIKEEIIRKSLKNVIHRGRFEKINNNPTVIYEGAHNEPAINNFINSVDMYYKNNKKVYIISILKSKDYKTILKLLVKNDENIYIFTCGNDKERYTDAEILKDEAQKSGAKNLFTMELEEAIKMSLEKYIDYIIFAVGSFYVYGDVIKTIKSYT